MGVLFMMFLSFSQPRGRDGIVKGWLLYVGQDTGLVITTLPTYLCLLPLPPDCSLLHYVLLTPPPSSGASAGVGAGLFTSLVRVEGGGCLYRGWVRGCFSLILT